MLPDNNLLPNEKDLQKSLNAAAARFIGNHAQELGNLGRKAEAVVHGCRVAALCVRTIAVMLRTAKRAHRDRG